MVKARVDSLLSDEIFKGCNPDISMYPVPLEPDFVPIGNIPNKSIILHDAPTIIHNTLKLQAWISPEQEFSWNSNELFLKQLQSVFHRVGLEVSGNSQGIIINILCHPDDAPIIQTSFEAEFHLNRLTHLSQIPLEKLPDTAWKNIAFREFYPSTPYSQLLTRPIELQTSPFKSLLTALSFIHPPAIGFYQALFQPVSPENNWHGNVQKLTDIEFNLKLLDGIQPTQRYAQQAPSGDLRQMSWEVENKAHNDKPFFCLVLRVGIVGAVSNTTEMLSSLSTFMNLFQHGGRPLTFLGHKEFLSVLSAEQIQNMIKKGLVHRSGFLVNSFELAGPVHLPPLNIREDRNVILEGLGTLPVRNPELLQGTLIGTCSFAGTKQEICLPENVRRTHCHLIGGTGTGKTTLEERMIIDDIEKGHGVAIIEPHGDFTERILRLIPQKFIDKTIYFNPGDPDWIPLWNPLDRQAQGQDISRTTGDILLGIQSFISPTGWGDRLENILRNILFSLMHLPNCTFLDVSCLLRNNSKENEIIIKEILKVVDNEEARNFWREDYEKYRKDDLSPPKNKLSKLLVNETVALMFSQPYSRINFRTIMDEGKIFLANFTTIGPTLTSVLGCFILSSLHQAALSRSDIAEPEKRKQFHIYVDEAHRFLTGAIEDMLVETRKYRVSLNLAHQQLSQLDKKKIDALSSVGSKIIFNVGESDATQLRKNLAGLVTVDDLVSLPNFEAVARIGQDVVRFRTLPPLTVQDRTLRERIIEKSHADYCLPSHEIKKIIRQRRQRWAQPFSPLADIDKTNSNDTIEEFYYDEF